MPVTVSHALSMTTPDDPAYENKPSNWNATHAVTFAASASELIKWISAGTTSVSSGTVNFANSNGISFGIDTNGQLTGTVATNYLTTAMASDAATLSAVRGVAGTASILFSRISFVDSNGVTWGGAGANPTMSITATVKTDYQTSGAYLTTAALSGDTSKYIQNWKLTGNSAGTQSSAQGTDLWLAGGQGITLSGSSNSISFSVGSYITTGDLSANSSNYARNWKLTGNSAGTQSSAIGTDLWLAGGQGITLSGSSNSISFSVGSYITTGDLSANSSNYARNWKLTGNSAGTQSSAIGTDLWLAGGQGITLSGSSNSISFSVGSYITTGRASTDAIGLNTAQTNVTWTVNSSGLSLNAAGYAGTTTAVTGNISVTQNSLGLNVNAANLAGTVTGASGNISITANTSGVSVSVPNIVTISSFENINLLGVANSQTFDGSTLSIGAAIQLPNYLSMSFIRFLASMSTNSTTLATSAASLSASVKMFTSYNAVIYSVGIGASSASLMSVTSTQATHVFMNSISAAANGSQWSITQWYTYPYQGVTTSTSQGYSATTTNMSFVTTGIGTMFTANRFQDIPFAVSLAPGAYWVIIGQSTGSSTNSTGISGASNCGNYYSYHLAVPQINQGVKEMGQTNNISANFGGAQFSTAGGGTTANLPMTALSSGGSNQKMYLQFLRSA